MINKLKLKNLILVSFYLIPVTTTICFIYFFGVDVPFWDEWRLVSLFDKTLSQKLSFQDLFAQHNEHRIFFPRLITIGFVLIDGWNTKHLMFLSIFIVAISYIFFCKINYLSYNKVDNKQHVFNFVIGILFFSLTQWENWLWGFQIAFFLVNLSLVLSIYCLVKINKNNLYRQLLFSAFWCFVASFSSAHGLTTWLAIIPNILGIKIRYQQKIKIIILWTFLFFISTFTYLIDYHKPKHHPNIFFSLEETITRIKYFFVLIGFWGDNIENKIIIGSLVFIIFYLFSFYYYCRNFNNIKKYYLPLLSLSNYSILFALMTTLGRAGFGVSQATSSRYTTPMIFIYISIVQSVYFVWFKENNLKYIIKRSLILKSVCVFFGIFLSFYFILSSINAFEAGYSVYYARIEGKNCLKQLTEDDFYYKRDTQCLSSLFPSVEGLIRQNNILKNLNIRKY